MEAMVLRVLSEKLEDLQIEHRDKVCEYSNGKLFKCVLAPDISITEYLYRIVEFFQCDHNTYIIAAIYIDRFVRKGTIPLNVYYIHRIVLAACIIARKYHEDEGRYQYEYAEIGGVSPKELMVLEMTFCDYLEWDLYVGDEYELFLHLLK